MATAVCEEGFNIETEVKASIIYKSESVLGRRA